MLDGILQGLGTAMMPINLFMVVVGCFVGTFIGMLPGLGPVTAIALMIPITYGLDPASGIILMAGVYYGSMFGGSTASILINTPGCSASMITAIDGYPLACKGQAGKALAIAAYASFVGGTLSAIFLMVAAPLLAKVSLSFQSADYFALMVLGLSAVAAFAGKGQVLKALIMALFGIMISTVGIDRSVGVDRFTFGLPDLRDGFSFLLLAMATFALAEILMTVLRPGKDTSQEEASKMQQLGSLKLSRDEVKEIAPPIARSSVLGFLIGVLPGAGATIASFMAYGAERNFARKGKRDEFGKGSLTGIAAPEAANNAASSGAFVPLLTLGIPGSGTTALMLGALIAYGIQPGPRLFMEHPDVFWSVIISMYLGNVVLLILNLPLIPYLAKILQVPRPVLIPMVLLFSLIGVYLVSFNTMDIYVMVLVALVAIGLRLLDFPMAPMLLGFILGGMLEDNLRRALVINDGSLSFLWERPITLGFTLVTLVMLLLPLWQWWQARRTPVATLQSDPT
ncbi:MULTISPECIES: tripartite tricarboxylate transporter permease [Aeromonas]|jgi:putative tricarboxylic transport membrane protein|uniref:Tripartite tricarboxylate transporter permease n=1 Tax=Aeromonas rivipollensis TaxID=948519 RepID=A0AAW9Y785_9GAMM|nr:MULTISPECIES: tripartite tricarboxylate transporter permease [Aeromonas]MBP8160390.1 tripartite tricarboxylate transporter permease [Aeromonas sp.]QIY86516.1 tripartite tricarboxylate transporter permease [Aeromonas hydrophila]AHX60727.1 tricarboxylic transport protein TctA [Aeromonas media WS]AVP94053.1 tripartite tricarboxylate transporter TctA [Aeromonas rivipollensis]MBS4699684.1 tripartite tricarboxylate transporter permease [Aeromonas media]